MVGVREGSGRDGRWVGGVDGKRVMTGVGGVWGGALGEVWRKSRSEAACCVYYVYGIL